MMLLFVHQKWFAFTAWLKERATIHHVSLMNSWMVTSFTDTSCFSFSDKLLNKCELTHKNAQHCYDDSYMAEYDYNYKKNIAGMRINERPSWTSESNNDRKYKYIENVETFVFEWSRISNDSIIYASNWNTNHQA